MIDSLDDVLTSSRGDDGAYLFDVRDGWQQGRGAFGGLVLGAMTRALTQAAGPERALRSLSAAITAPVLPGPARIAIATIRAGNAVSTLQATLMQDGENRAQATAVLGATRPGTPSWLRMSPPRATPWRELPDAQAPAQLAPTFTRHFDLRVSAGGLFSGRPTPEIVGWVRPRGPARRRDAALIVALVDCYFPVLLSELAAPRPVATLTFHLDLCGTLDGLDPESPLLYRGTMPTASDGYAVEQRELWGEDGRLIALNQQIFVIIK